MECGESFAQAVELKRHMQSDHIHLKPYACSICGKDCLVTMNCFFGYGIMQDMKLVYDHYLPPILQFIDLTPSPIV